MYFEILIPLLVGISVVTLGTAWLIDRVSRRGLVAGRLRQLETGQTPVADTSASAMVPATRLPALIRVLERIGNLATSGQPSLTLREQLAQAGFHHRAAHAIYLGSKLLLFLVGLPLAAAMFSPLDWPVLTKVVAVLGVATLLFFLPNMDVAVSRQRRHGEVRRHLPDAIDLLEICVSAGMGLDQAWNSVSDEVRTVSPTLADEMALTDLEIHLGASRAVAMRHMAERTGSQELSSLVAILVQSERFGTSVADALRTFAQSMREQRSMRAQEAAEKMAIKLLFPMILCIFPAVVIIMVGPAFLTFYKALSSP